ncbi:MAG: thioesterase family protein [Pseudobacteriovorax sp.]|nr:thioesterase family protein [Pseudobacteriovorax sp.]
MTLTNQHKFQVRFSDLDANRHLRNTAYSEFAAQSRFNLLHEMGFTMKDLAAAKIGPIIFSEHAAYHAETLLGDQVIVHTYLAEMSESGHKWQFKHEIYKNTKTLAAVLTTTGAWMNLSERRVAAPPEALRDKFNELPQGHLDEK